MGNKGKKQRIIKTKNVFSSTRIDIEMTTPSPLAHPFFYDIPSVVIFFDFFFFTAGDLTVTRNLRGDLSSSNKITGKCPFFCLNYYIHNSFLHSLIN